MSRKRATDPFDIEFERHFRIERALPRHIKNEVRSLRREANDALSEHGDWETYERLNREIDRTCRSRRARMGVYVDGEDDSFGVDDGAYGGYEDVDFGGEDGASSVVVAESVSSDDRSGNGPNVHAGKCQELTSLADLEFVLREGALPGVAGEDEMSDAMARLGIARERNVPMKRKSKADPYIRPSKSVDHGTPLEVVECALRAIGGDEFDLDPAASLIHSSVPAVVRHTGVAVGGDDGLEMPWVGRVFNNPPYGRALAKWVAKARESMESGDAQIQQLLPLRGAQWFLDEVLGFATAVCFIRGRLTFLGSTDPYPVSNIVVLWGDGMYGAFCEAFSVHVPAAKVLRKHSKTGSINWVRLKRPLGRVIDLRKARRAS